MPTCALCGSSDLSIELQGWRCENCGALTRNGEQVPDVLPLPDEREQAREHAAMAAEDAAVKDDLDARQPHERRTGGRL